MWRRKHNGAQTAFHGREHRLTLTETRANRPSGFCVWKWHHVLLIAALAEWETSSRPQPVEAVMLACALLLAVAAVPRGSAIALASPGAVAVSIADPGAGAHPDQFRDLGGQPGAQSRLQLPGAARQPGDQGFDPACATIRLAAAPPKRRRDRATGAGASSTGCRSGPTARAISSATSAAPQAVSLASAPRSCRM